MLASGGVAREWKDASGKYSVKGDLIAYNAEQAVIKKSNGNLIAANIADLSVADREYLKSKESEDMVRAHANRLQTWTFRGGYKATGRLVDYIRRDVQLVRKRGRVYVNDRPLENLPDVYQVIVRRIVSHFENVPIENNRDVDKWLNQKEHNPRKYTCDGVILELENGDEVALPFFLFSETDLMLLEPGWERWLKAKEDEAAKARETFLLTAQARAYDAQRQQAQQAQQIAYLQLGLLATAVGALELWEVALEPPPGAYATPLSVIVPGRDSEAATAAALQRYPGYIAGPVRRALP
jgi:hypothetical protein